MAVPIALAAALLGAGLLGKAVYDRFKPAALATAAIPTVTTNPTTPTSATPVVTAPVAPITMPMVDVPAVSVNSDPGANSTPDLTNLPVVEPTPGVEVHVPDGSVPVVIDPTVVVPTTSTPVALVGPPMRQDLLDAWIQRARAATRAERIQTPPGASAVDFYRYVLTADPRNAPAQSGLAQLVALLMKKAADAHAASEFGKAKEWLDKAAAVAATKGGKADLATPISAQRDNWLGQWMAAGKSAEEKWDRAAAASAYNAMLIIDPTNSAAKEALVRSAKLGIKGFVFRDALKSGGESPEMVVSAEGKLALGRFEVTVGQFKRFISASGHRVGAEPCRNREGFFSSSRDRNYKNPGYTQTDQHPVVCISFEDAMAYTKWLSEQSGHRYRLLKLAEWQAAARGASNKCGEANLADQSFNKEGADRKALSCDDTFAAAAPAGRYKPTAGIYDLSGNVREWIDDCANAACSERSAIGTSWMSDSDDVRATPKQSWKPTTLNNTVGFRLARDI
jgi:serine/threonine-protein kinase PpkA